MEGYLITYTDKAWNQTIEVNGSDFIDINLISFEEISLPFSFNLRDFHTDNIEQLPNDDEDPDIRRVIINKAFIYDGNNNGKHDQFRFNHLVKVAHFFEYKMKSKMLEDLINLI